MDLEKKLKDEGKWNLWWDACFVVAVTLVLLTWPLPSGQLIGTLPSTEAFFMFSVTNTQKNTTAGIGYVELRGVGGLSVDNKLTLTVKLDLTGNASDPILSSPDNVVFTPENAYAYSASASLTNFPKSVGIDLNKTNNWKGSTDVVFYAPGGEGNDLTFQKTLANGTTEYVEITAPRVFQISPTEATVSAFNDEITLSLSLLVVAFVCLELRSEKESKGRISSQQQTGQVDVKTEKIKEEMAEVLKIVKKIEKRLRDK